jgi:Protein of unknown function (DUF1566)
MRYSSSIEQTAHGKVRSVHVVRFLRMERHIACFVTVITICLNATTATASCEKSRSASTPTSRFTLIEDKAYDQKTKLTWQRCSVGATWKKGAGCIGRAKLMNLTDATKFAKLVGNDWRVPTIEELYSIVERRCKNPAINTAVFPNVKDLGEGAPYWTSSKIEEIPPLVYYIDFLNGDADGHTKGFSLAVRLVRNNK